MADALRRYDIDGLGIAVSGQASAPADFLDSILGPYAAAGPGTAGWSIEVALAEELPPAPAGDLRWAGALPEGPAAVLTESEAE